MSRETGRGHIFLSSKVWRRTVLITWAIQSMRCSDCKAQMILAPLSVVYTAFSSSSTRMPSEENTDEMAALILIPVFFMVASNSSVHTTWLCSPQFIIQCAVIVMLRYLTMGVSPHICSEGNMSLRESIMQIRGQFLTDRCSTIFYLATNRRWVRQ